MIKINHVEADIIKKALDIASHFTQLVNSLKPDDEDLRYNANQFKIVKGAIEEQEDLL